MKILHSQIKMNAPIALSRQTELNRLQGSLLGRSVFRCRNGDDKDKGSDDVGKGGFDGGGRGDGPYSCTIM